MPVDVQEVGVNVIEQYIIMNPEDLSNPWVASVMDLKVVMMMLKNGRHSRERKSYGLFIGDVMIGYAVIHVPYKHLDLLHVAEDFRGRGYAERFLRQLDIASVVVEASNAPAITLYTKLGYDLELYEEDINVAC